MQSITADCSASLAYSSLSALRLLLYCLVPFSFLSVSFFSDDDGRAAAILFILYCHEWEGVSGEQVFGVSPKLFIYLFFYFRECAVWVGSTYIEPLAIASFYFVLGAAGELFPPIGKSDELAGLNKPSEHVAGRVERERESGR